jgi:hypothetical protein
MLGFPSIKPTRAFGGNFHHFVLFYRAPPDQRI